MSMTPQQFLETLGKLEVWGHHQQRAPHKPLLLLLMLGKVKQERRHAMRYSELEPELQALLGKFGPERKNHRAYYPFKRLCNDGDGDLWEVEHTDRIRLTSSGNFFETDLREVDPLGGFTESVARLLKAHPELIESAAQLLLHKEFPQTWHQDVLIAVGLAPPEDMLRDREPLAEYREEQNPYAPIVYRLVRQRVRDPSFRKRVLRSYRGQCTICSYDGTMDNAPIGIEAAHIKWHSYNGPDLVRNGLALCSIHHHAMDRGAITLDENLKVRVSKRMEGEARKEYFLNFAGEPLRYLPRHPRLRPSQEYLEWHRDEVFKG